MRTARAFPLPHFSPDYQTCSDPAGHPLECAGIRPGGRGTFLLRGKNVPKEALPASSVLRATLAAKGPPGRSLNSLRSDNATGLPLANLPRSAGQRGIESTAHGGMSFAKMPTKSFNSFRIAERNSGSGSDGNSEPANRLLKLPPLTTKKSGAREALIKYFETWGKLYFDSFRGTLNYSKKHIAHTWTSEYEAQVRANVWAELIESLPDPSVFDADKEFRKVLDRLNRISEDSTNTILHASLLSKVQEVLYAYGHTDEWTGEEKRNRTLFDQSVKRATTRASKYAKAA